MYVGLTPIDKHIAELVAARLWLAGGKNRHRVPPPDQIRHAMHIADYHDWIIMKNLTRAPLYGTAKRVLLALRERLQ